MTYDELLKKYNEALGEIERLKAENADLKRKLCPEAASIIAETNTDNNSINKYSSSAEKIELFRSLFKGREDVFAKRWYGKTTEKSGYQPVCENKWAEGLCDKRKFKCAACPNRKLSALSDNFIYEHLSGKDEYCRDVVGIYPMLTDETCFFVCADFDDADYQKDSSAFRQACADHNIPVYVERSRSGNGAHAWIFFDSPVSAASARKLGSLLLTYAMQKRGELSFKSYDRLFPNQDTMPDGGFGNLIALPLQGKARKNGNSVFVDENFEPYPDQWAFLSSIRRISADLVEVFISTHQKNNELGELLKDSEEKPWETKKPLSLNACDFPESLQIVCANMLYVPLNGLSGKAINALKRLAAFKNPDFYRAQAMRMPVYDKPRVICCAELSDEYLALPRGCEEALKSLLDKTGVNFIKIDKTNSGKPIQVEFDGQLREEQEIAAKAILEYKNGVLSATTAFGKTVIASYLISERKTNTLILVHTQSLLTQWKKSLEDFLKFDITPPEKEKRRGRKTAWSPVGLLGAQKNTLKGNVDVAIMQSALTDGEVKQFVRDYGMIIVDECHHVSAVNFEKILKYANAKYVYGLTATPARQDGHQPIIFMQCGPIRYRVDAKAQAEKRSFGHYIIPRFTSFRTAAEKTITTLYKDLSQDPTRNGQIIKDVLEALKNKRTPIVLTERREHVELLKEAISKKCENVIALVGACSAKERKETLEKLHSAPADKDLVIIATGKYVGEGFDFPRLDTLFLALPIAWKGKVAQYAGRLHRNYEGKTEVRIYDYVDIHVPMLEKMYQKRLCGYASIGYKSKTEASDVCAPDLIYDGRSFYPVFAADVTNAKSEIMIVSPFMRKTRLTQIIKVLSPVMINGVSVTVVTRPPDDFKQADRESILQNTEKLKEYGIQVKYKSNFHQKFTVMDKRTVWYGSVNFLSFGSNEESIMRFDNYDIAGQLIDTVM